MKFAFFGIFQLCDSFSAIPNLNEPNSYHRLKDARKWSNFDRKTCEKMRWCAYPHAHMPHLLCAMTWLATLVSSWSFRKLSSDRVFSQLASTLAST